MLVVNLHSFFEDLQENQEEMALQEIQEMQEVQQEMAETEGMVHREPEVF
jgi:hypothetical protein